jgi:hypothetical protein
MNIEALHSAIITDLVKICRHPVPHEREVLMQNMIDMLCQAHVEAVGALLGALLITAKGLESRDEDYTAQLDCVRDLVEKSDAEYSLRLRSAVLNFVAEHKTPDPFKIQKPAKEPEIVSPE